MLFPNFYVPSLGCEDGGFLNRSRMSLSHSGAQEQSFRQIHSEFTPKNTRTAIAARFPMESGRQSLRQKRRSLQLSGGFRV
jgi:hypothetical protein